MKARWCRSKQKNKTKNIYIWAICQFKYIFFCFILLFTSPSPCRKGQFAVSYFSISTSTYFKYACFKRLGGLKWWPCFAWAVNASHGFFQVRRLRSRIYMVYFSLSQRILRLPDRVINKYRKFIFFQACERAESYKSCNLIGSESGGSFRSCLLIRAESLATSLTSWLLFVNEQKPSFSNHFSFKTCAIIAISQGKVNIIFQTKNLKGESSKSARKTVKVNQNRWLVMSLH